MSIEINLLPWREALRARRSKRFHVALGCVVALGVGGGYAMTWHVEQHIDAQRQRNAYIQHQGRQLDALLSELDELESMRGRMHEQVEAFSELYLGRFQTVSVFGDLAVSLVDGIHYTRLTRQGDSLLLAGRAESGRQVSEQLLALAEAVSFVDPVLAEAEAEGVGERRRFSLVMGQRMPPAGTGERQEERDEPR